MNAISVTGHPIHHQLRKSGEMFSFPVTIGNNVWIGDNSVIGAGSVVTKDIPSDVVAVGNPCRVIRTINERDKEYYFKNYKVEPSA